MKISKWTLGSVGISAATAGAAYVILYLADTHQDAELIVLGAVFLAIGIICFSLCRSKRIPKYAEKEWMMTLPILSPVIKFFLVFLALRNGFDEKLFPIGISYIADLPLLVVGNNIRQKQQKKKANAQTSEAAKQHVTEAIDEFKAEKMEKGQDPSAISAGKTAEQPTAEKESAEPGAEKAEGDVHRVGADAKEPTDPEPRSDKPMQECRYEKAGLIAQAFESNKIKFYIIEGKELEVVCAAFQIKNGPSVNACFFVEQTGCVSLRVTNLVTDIPEEKRLRMLEACNVLNAKLRFFKFSLNKDNAVYMALDFLDSTPKEALGLMACEAFLRTMNVLNTEYGVFMKAFYTNESLGS